MTTHLTQSSKTGYFYFTITCYNWIPLFEITSLYDYLYNWFDKMKETNILTNAYVIMPNHLHAVVYANGIFKDINDIIGSGKRFISYEVVKRLKILKDFALLQKLSEAVPVSDRKRGKLHNVFEPSLDIKEITTEKFIIQKINYIHQNPVRGKWRLVEDYRAYKYSSTGFYEPIPSKPYSGYGVVQYNGIEEAIEKLML